MILLDFILYIYILYYITYILYILYRIYLLYNFSSNLLQQNSARPTKTEQYIYLIAGKTSKLIYCNSEFHVFPAVSYIY